MTTPIDIGTATLERMRPDLVVVRFKPGSIASAESFLVSMSARQQHFADIPHAVMVVAPDDVDFHPSMLNRDHYKGQDVDAITLLLAVVSDKESFTRVLELYYALHPVAFPVRIF